MSKDTKRAGRILLALAFVWMVCGWNQASQATQNLNVLFIGNSHTAYNNMPELFKYITVYAGQPLPRTVYYVPGGYTLAQHAKDPTTLDQIANGYGPDCLPWDYVVLQEHSAYPAYAEVDEYYRSQFQGAANDLYDKIKIKSPGAKVVLFETPAWHQSYFDGNGGNTYMGSSAAEMQARVRKWCNHTAYSYIPANSNSGSKNDALIAPIGDAWEKNYNDPNSILLHSSDLYHPNRAGSYLGALIMYSTIYNALPQGISYTAGLDQATANHLQQIATATMIPEPAALTTLLYGAGCMLLFRYRRRR